MKSSNRFYKSALPILMVCAFLFTYINLESQCKTSAEFFNAVNELANTEDRLQRAKSLLQQYVDCRFPKDSVYVRILDRIAVYSFEKDLDEAIRFGGLAVEASRKNGQGFSPKISGNAYSNLAYFYQQLGWYSKALTYYDSAMLITGNDQHAALIHFGAKLNSAVLSYDVGDYQKCINESNSALLMADNPYKTKFKVKRAEAYLIKKDFARAEASALEILQNYEKGLEDISSEAWATGASKLVLAKLYAVKKEFSKADYFFNDVLNSIDPVISIVAKIDFAKYLTLDKRDYLESIKVIEQLTSATAIDNEGKALLYTNLSQAYYRDNKYGEANDYFLKALDLLGYRTNNQLLTAIVAKDWNQIVNKDLMMVMLDNKIELLIDQYRRTGEKRLLDAALQSAKVADSVLSINRREQMAEQSKLVWRDRTREIYQYAIEASYLAKNYNTAFYFFEKSRSVLLNDQINQKIARQLLPDSLQRKEQELTYNLVKSQSALSPGNIDYTTQLKNFQDAQEEFEHFIKSLEYNHPLYYLAKYADNVPDLSELQSHLAKNDQTFMHYFMADTVAYVMAISANEVMFKKISEPQYNKQDIVDFLQLCSQPDLLNTNYAKYQQLSNSIFDTYLEPFNIKKTRVIICPDNYLVPFEAIVVDDKPTHFLLHDYAFSYVYAARNLLMNYPLKKSEGNFLGIAPVSFASYLKVPSLRESGKAIKISGAFYDNTNLIVGEKATRKSFLKSIGNYEVVNVYSHAQSDSSVEEPAVFMNDSVIYLSELQLINDISAQLVLLSACQTSVGKNATGEGIYSLARGLAAVGIPAVAATLWEADESSIYAITEKFNEGISKGLPKDIALQEAKIWYLNNANAEKKLAPYWSNMIIIGDVSPVAFSKHTNTVKLLALAGFAGLLLIVIFILTKRFKSKRRQLPLM